MIHAFPLLFAEPRGEEPECLAPWFDPIDALAELVGGFRPNGRRDKVLIVAIQGDMLVHRVGIELVRRGIPARRFNVDTLNRTSSLSFEMDAAGRRNGVLTLPTGVVALEEVQSVWFTRRLSQLLGPSGAGVDGAELFARQETEAALLGLTSVLDHAMWVNPVASLQGCGSKLKQLQIAARLGLCVPRTMVTNDERRARDFIATCPGGVVVKTFRWLFGTARENAGLVYTHRVLPEHHASLGLVSHAPCILQEEVPREAELRITIVGRRVLAAEMVSATPSEAPVDWRDPRANVTLRTCTLSAAVEARCLALADYWGLGYAALDVIRRPDGEHVFLDLNPHGNWLHVENATGLPITAALVDLLESTELPPQATGSNADPD